MEENSDIKKKQGEFIASVNKLNAKFGTVQSNIKSRLLQTYCTSWYGCQLWELGSSGSCRMNTQWNKSIRRTLKLPYTTHCMLLPLVAGNGNFHSQQEIRVNNLYHTMYNSENSVVSQIAARACTNSCGTLGRNRIFLRNKYGMPRQGRFQLLHNEVARDDFCCAQQILELLCVRDGSSHVVGLDMQEIISMINYLCSC